MSYLNEINPQEKKNIHLYAKKERVKINSKDVKIGKVMNRINFDSLTEY